MSTKFKRAASFVMSFLMALTNMGSVPVLAGGEEKPSELAAEAVDIPVKYTVTLPYYEECVYIYDESRVKDNSGSIKLLYEANEKVVVSLRCGDQVSIDRVRVVDSGKHEISSSWSGSKMEFTMPEQDVSLNVSFTTLETDPPQIDPPRSEPAEEKNTEVFQSEVTEEEPVQVSPLAERITQVKAESAEEESDRSEAESTAEEFSRPETELEEGAEEPTQAGTESVAEEFTQSVAEEFTQTGAESVAEEFTQSVAEEFMQAGAESAAEEFTQTGAESAAEEFTQTGAESAVEEFTQTGTEFAAEEFTQTGTESVAEELTQSGAEEPTQAGTESGAEEFTQAITEFAAEESAPTEEESVEEKKGVAGETAAGAVGIEPETMVESETLAERDLVNETGRETEPADRMEAKEETETAVGKAAEEASGEPRTESVAAAEDYVTYSMVGEGTVTIFTCDENGSEEILCSLTKSGEAKKVSLDGVEHVLRVRMTPNTGWFPYEMADREDSVVNLFTQADDGGTYEGALFFTTGDMKFRFLDEETLSGIPMLLGDGAMNSGGDYYWIYQKGATKDADIAAPRKNDIFVVNATYKQHCKKENGGYTEFAKHPGSAVIPEDSAIAQYLGTTFKFNTCGVGSKPVPQTGNKGKLYILIKGVTKTATGTKVSYQYFFWNSVSKYQSVYYKGTKTYTLYGLKIVKTLANEDSVAGCPAYDLAATFTIKDSKGKVVKTVTADPDSGEILVTDLDEGIYTITETKTSKGATVYAGKEKTVEYTKEKIMSVKFQNYPVVIELTVEKRDAEGVWHDSMKNAVYSLREQKDDEKTEIERVIITGQSVKVKTPLCVNETYYLVEVEEPPSGKWALNSKPVKVSTAVSAEKMAALKGSDNVVKMTSRVTENPPSPIKVRIEKKTNLIESANGNKAEWLDNGYYDLKGAAFEFYWDKNGADLIGTATIKEKNSEGHYYSNWVEIPTTDISAKTITVYYRETRRPNGHIQDKEIHSLKLNVPEDDSKTVTVTEESLDDFTYARLDALVTKVNSAGEPLEGAEFTLTYYARPQSDEIVYQWVFRTNEQGRLDLWNPVNGETVFVNNPGTGILFPEGYYSIEETKAPDGYVNAGFYKEFTLTPSRDEEGYYTIRRCELPETYTVQNSSTSDVRIQKASTVSGYNVAGCVFEVSLTSDFSRVVGTLISKEDGYSDYLEIQGEDYKAYLKGGYFDVYVRETGVPDWFTRNTGIEQGICVPGRQTTITFHNVPKGYVSVAKISSNPEITAGNGMYSFEGAKFHVSTTPDMGNVVATLTAKADGTTDPVGLDAGSYYIQEASAPRGYKRNTGVYDVTLAGGGTASVTIEDEPITGSMGAMLIKKPDGSTTRPLAGAEFTVKYFDNEVCGGTPVRTWVLKSDEKGEVWLKNQALVSGDEFYGENLIPLGSLEIREIKAPEGYAVSDEVKQVTISHDGKEESSFAYAGYTNDAIWKETPLFGGVRIAKTCADMGKSASGDASLGGAVYQVINHDSEELIRAENPDVPYAPGQEIARITTNSDGIAEIGAVLQAGKYIIKEVSPSTGYLVNTSYAQEFEITEGGQIVDLTGTPVPEPIIRGGFALEKWDGERNESGLPQGDARLSGAEFTLVNDSEGPVKVDVNQNGILEDKESFAPGETIAVLATDEKGRLSTPADYLPYGTYTLTETKAPEGYRLEKAVNESHTIRIRRDGQYEDFTQKEKITRDYVARGGFELEKWDKERNEASVVQGDASLAGAEFTLVNSGAESVLVDADGDGEFGKTELFGPGDTIAVFTTDDKGYLSTPADYLPYGTYTLTETKPPLGYTTDGENLVHVIRIRRNGQYDCYTTGSSAAKNRVIRGDLELVKFRDTLSSQEPGDDMIPVEGCEFEVRLKSTGELFCVLVTDEYGYATTADRENYPYGRLPYGTYTLTETKWPEDLNPVKPFDVTIDMDRRVYRGIYKNNQPIEMPITLVKTDAESGLTIPISGTEFQILDENKELITFTNHYPHEERVANFVTDGSGTITLPEKLPQGTYYVREVKAPFGYLRGNDQIFRITESGKWEKPLTVTCQDRPAKGKVRVAKYDADTKEFISGAVFAVFAAEDIVTGDGITHHAKGSYVSTFTTGEDGIGWSGELYLGKYYLQETRAPEGYCLDTERHYFEAEYADQETPVVFIKMEKGNKPTTLKLYKGDPDGRRLGGVTFRMERLGGQEGTGSEDSSAIGDGTFVSDEEGLITAKYLVSGIYSVEETAALPGYVTDHTIRYVTVDANGYIYESDMTGKALDEDKAKSNIETISWINEYTKWDFSKKDVTGDKELPGAKLEIYDSAGKLVAEWISAEEPHRINGLPVGAYTLVEKTAPEGYVKASSVPFRVTDTAAVEKAVMADKRVAINKYDVTLKSYVKGAVLEIHNDKDEVVDRWITDGNVHYASNLTAGKSYRLVERNAPEGYALALPVSFTVEDDGKDQSVTIVNKRILVSKVDAAVRQLAGAKLEVRDGDGNVVDRWVSDGTAHPVSGLKIGGTYTLVETEAPEGYAVASSVIFTVSEIGEDEELSLVNKQVLVTKTDITGEREVPGAVLSVWPKSGTNEGTEAAVDQWVSDELAHPISNIAVGKTYVLREELVPDGYTIANEIEFTVNDDFRNQHVMMKDDVTKVEITKTDITNGEPLIGAELIIRDRDGNEVERWITEEKPHYIEGLPVGTYTLIEVSAPDGYATAEAVSFTVADTGDIQKVNMEDDVIKVSITKADLTDGKPVIGAELVIRDKDGNEVERWITAKEPHDIEKLRTGTYTLTEIRAPEGYETAETIRFEVADSMEVQQVTMYDAPRKKTVSRKPGNGTTAPVKTGDRFRYLPAIILVGLGAVLLILDGVLKIKNKKKE